MKSENQIKQLAKGIRIKPDAVVDERVLAFAEAVLAKTTKNQGVVPLRRPSIRSKIVKSPITKLAAAAVILIGVLILTSLFVGTNKNVVLAGVLERVEQAQAYMYKIDMTMTEHTNPEIPMIQKIEGTIIVSNEYGTKSEMRTKWQVDKGIPDSDPGRTTTKLRYILPNQKLEVLIKPDQKKYERTELDDDRIARRKKEDNDPREMMKQMLECEYTEMGRTVLNGIEVEGFETTDPKFAVAKVEDPQDVRVKLWVDVKTWLPVLWETEETINEQMSLHTVVHDFQWDIPVAASDFEPVIPADYTSINEYELPSKFEEEALKGLRFFVEIFGRYPEDIDQNSLVREFAHPYLLRNRENLTDAGLKLKEELESLMDHEQQWMQRAMEISKPIKSIGVFYTVLGDIDRDRAYYGQTVGPEDTDAVLMRWKVSDDEYRVIFGDLSVGNVTAEELAELEKTL